MTESIPTSSNKKPGCLFWGCLTVGIMFFLGGGCVGLIAYQSYKTLESITADSPAPIPIYPVTPTEKEAILDRIQIFQTGLSNNQSVELKLTANDLNALVAINPESVGKIYFDIQDNFLLLQQNMPLNNIPGFSDQYINGTVALSVNFENGQLTVIPQDFLIDGNPIPQQIVESMKQQNLAQIILDNNQDIKLFLSQVDQIRIENGEVSLIVNP